MKRLLILVPVGLLALGALYDRGPEAGPPVDRAAEIKAGCEREFAAQGPDAVAQCRWRLTARELDQVQRGKLDAAGQ